MNLLNLIIKIDEGYSEGKYRGLKYGITKTIFNNGRSFKVYAEELGGNDFISLNYYATQKEDILKPCEMPVEKVVDFLYKVELLKNKANGLL